MIADYAKKKGDDGMTKIICDLCGEPIDTYDCHYKYKIKKHWCDEYGNGWTRLDAHAECIEAVAAAVRERKEG